MLMIMRVRLIVIEVVKRRRYLPVILMILSAIDG